MNPDTKNLIAAICLSMSVLIGYQILFGEPTEQNVKNEEKKIEKNNDTSINIPKSTKKGNLNKNLKSIKNIPRVKILNNEIDGSISLLGARIDDLTLVNYKETLEPESKQIRFLKKIEQKEPFFIQFGWMSEENDNETKVPSGNTIWSSSSKILQPGKDITLTWNNKQGVTFYQIISIDQNFMIKVKQKVKNNSNKSINLYPYGLIRRAGEPKTTDFFVLHEGPLGVVDGELKEESYSDVKESGAKGLSYISEQKGGWIGITDKYWMAALIPDQNQKVNFEHTYINNSSYQTAYFGSLLTVPANSEQVFSTRAFSGAKKLDLLDKYEEDLKIKNFDLAIDFGWFYFLTKPFFYALSWANSILGNFGLAILAITVIVKIIFFPLANKSYKSMARMRVLTPQLQQLRERFGNDRQKMNVEMMALYKREKVNPAAGCLPILVQIPVFFALYKVLFVSIEMRQAPFFGWIDDLSALDPTSIFNLFGLLPYSTDFLPDFLNLGIWPLLMGATMVLQQRLNPKPPDPVQAQIFAWMPVVFTFLLATFPAGLVIYWTWNNLLSIAQQWIITRKINKENS